MASDRRHGHLHSIVHLQMQCRMSVRCSTLTVHGLDASDLRTNRSVDDGVAGRTGTSLISFYSTAENESVQKPTQNIQGIQPAANDIPATCTKNVDTGDADHKRR